MFLVKPRLKQSIEGNVYKIKKKQNFLFLLSATLAKKCDPINAQEKTQVTKDEGRFQTYPGRYYFHFMLEFNKKNVFFFNDFTQLVSVQLFKLLIKIKNLITFFRKR